MPHSVLDHASQVSYRLSHSPGPERTNPRAAFQYRDFRFFQLSKFLFTIGWQMQNAGVGYQLYELTHDPFVLGMIGLVQFIPAISLSLITGQVADRYDRRKIVSTCQASLALCSLALFALTAAGVTNVYAYYTVLFFVGVAHSFLGPATQALVPHLVPQQHFPNAVAWNSSIWQIAAIAGPAVGGFVYDAFGPQAVYLSDVLLTSIAFLCMVQVRAKTGRQQTAAVSWETAVAGLKYVWRRKVILGAISMDLFAVLFGGAVALMPIYARDILHVGAVGNGLLRAAPGVGAALVAMIIAFLPPMRRAGAVMYGSVAGFGVATIIFGVSTNFALSLVALFTLGALDMVSVVVRHTLVQVVTPEAMRGRVSAVNLVFINASNELGQFESGVTARWFGTVPSVIIGGIGTLLVVGIWAVIFPQLRKFGRLDAQNVLEQDDDLAADEEARTP